MATKISTYGTWNIDPEFPVVVEPKRVTDASPSSSGSVQRKDVQQSVGVDSTQPTTRLFALKWKNATEAEWLAYVSLWESSARGALPIAYTPQDGTEIAVRIRGNPRRRRHRATVCEFSVMLEEQTNGAS